MASEVYKVLGRNRRPFHGGTGKWPPPGEWISVSGKIVPCKNGLHLCREVDLVWWLGPAIWVAEADGEIVACDDKVVASRARLVSRVETWTERTARLFAADCAEHVLHLFESQRPSDSRPRDAIAAARAYARGEITAAARAAAGDAAWAAAGAAARAAARDSAWAAARDSAWAAARESARDSTGEAAWAAERAWQTARLLQYLRGEVSDGD